MPWRLTPATVLNGGATVGLPPLWHEIPAGARFGSKRLPDTEPKARQRETHGGLRSGAAAPRPAIPHHTPSIHWSASPPA